MDNAPKANFKIKLKEYLIFLEINFCMTVSVRELV